MQSNLNKDANSTILNLEVLKKEYDTVLIRYNQAQSDFTSSMSEDNSFVEIKGKTYWGTGLLSEDWATTSLDDCKNACASNKKCTGATYNPDKTYCSLRTGESGVSDGLESDYAIMSKKLKQLKVLSALSDRLLEINNQILEIVKQGRPKLAEMKQEKEKQISSLSQNYSGLKSQRESLNKTIREMEKLSGAENDSEIVITKNYSTYLLLTIVTLLIGIGVTVFSATGKSNSPGETRSAPPETKETFTEEEEEIPLQEGGKGKHMVKPTHRYLLLIIVSVMMVLLTVRLAASCYDYVISK
jgi:hypothetical protein